MEREIFRVLEDNLTFINAEFQKLNKRAKKIGVQELSIEILNKEDEVQEDGTVIRFANVVVNGECPCFEGWTFVASVEHLTAGNIVNKIAHFSEIDLTNYNHTDPHCEHCNKVRARKRTFIIKHNSGEIKQVGSTCVKDFLPTVDPKYIVRFCDLLIEMRSVMARGGDGSEKVVPRVPVERVLTVTAAIIEKHGWVSKSKHDDTQTPTAYLVDSYFFDKAVNKWRNSIAITEDHEKLAKDALEWLNNQEGNSEYINNLKIFVAEGSVTSKHFGYVCSLIPSYVKAVIEPKEKGVASEWFGEIKERLEIKVQVLHVAIVEGFRGSKRIVSMKTEEGNACVWFGTSFKDTIEVDSWYVIKGTVKDHSEYNGRKQTVLTRVSFTPIS